jgi:phage terminase large subunit-like protein
MTRVPWDGVPEHWGLGNYRDVPISKWVKKARERHIRDLKRSQEDPSFPYYFDAEEADRAVEWIETCIVHWKGRFAGRPFLLTDWQEWDVVRVLLGWKRRSDDSRRFRRALMMIARKNGKSSLLAAIALYMLCADDEAGAQVFCAATKEEQAKIVWRDATKFIKRSAKLRRRLRCLSRSIVYDDLDAEMKFLGKDSDTQDGLDVHCGIIDEYHAHKDSSMLGVLDTGTGARDQPLIAAISTAGFDANSPCKREQDVAERILDGLEENDEYFAYLCTVDDPEKWDCEDEWYKANPQLGLSIKIENLRGKVKQAKLSPSDLAQFKVKNLNIWLSSKEPWIPMELWKATERDLEWSSLINKNLPAWVAVDLGRVADLSAVAVTIKAPLDDDPEKFRTVLRTFHFCPESIVEERSKDAYMNYRRWIESGHLEATPGRVTRQEYIIALIDKLARAFDLKEVVYDPWNAGDLESKLTDQGITTGEFRQNISNMAQPCRTFEEMLVAETLERFPNPVLDWQISHATVYRDPNGNMKLVKPDDKKNKELKRIDGLVASVMSVGRASLAPWELEESVGVFAM